MAKKIKHRRTLSKEEREAERQAKEEEKAREEAGIQDEFQAKGFELATWVQDNQGVVYALLAVIVVVGLGSWGMQLSGEAADEEATAAFLEASDVWTAPVGDDVGEAKISFKTDAERAEKAMSSFAGVASSHAGTGIAPLARLYEGHAALRLGKLDEAATAYRAFLSEAASDDPLRFAAFEGLAAALEAKGDIPGAAQQLEAIVTTPGKINGDVALLKLARMHKRAGDAGKAKESADRLVRDFPDSPFKSEAQELLDGLGTDKNG